MLFFTQFSDSRRRGSERYHDDHDRDGRAEIAISLQPDACSCLWLLLYGWDLLRDFGFAKEAAWSNAICCAAHLDVDFCAYGRLRRWELAANQLPAGEPERHPLHHHDYRQFRLNPGINPGPAGGALDDD